MIFGKKKAAVSAKGFKVVIADDEADVRTLLEKGLTSAGFTVISASDGQEALEKVESEKPNLVVLDITMPKVNGLEVLQKIKTNPQTRNLPVIMLTADQDLLRGYKYGADYYIPKPFTFNMVLAGINLIFKAKKEEKYQI